MHAEISTTAFDLFCISHIDKSDDSYGSNINMSNINGANNSSDNRSSNDNCENCVNNYIDNNMVIIVIAIIILNNNCDKN